MKSYKEFMTEGKIDLYKTSDDVESKLGSTLVKKLSNSIKSSNEINSINAGGKWYSIDTKLDDQLTKKLGIYSSDNYYRVSNKFLIRFNGVSNKWQVGV